MTPLRVCINTAPINARQSLDTSFYVYILLCADNTYYTGHTDDLEQRIPEHRFGGKCKYTTDRRPIKLVWSFDFPTRDEAKAVEKQIKKWSQSKKRALIAGDWYLIKQLAKKCNWEEYRIRASSRAGGPNTPGRK